MKIVNSFSECLEHRARLALREELLSKDLVQELATLQQLSYNVNLVFGIVNLQKEHTGCHCGSSSKNAKSRNHKTKN